MRNIIYLSVVAILATILFGCAASLNVPSWVQETPKDPNYLFGTGVGESSNLQIALEKASTAARVAVAQQIEIYVKSLQKKFLEEVGSGQESEINDFFSSATKTVVSTTLVGSRVTKQDIKKKGDINTVYALIEYPIGESNLALQNQIKKNQAMYQRFRASESMKELDDEVQKYEEWKKTQN